MVMNSLGASEVYKAEAKKPNKNLDGHKLLILTPGEPPKEYIDKLHKTYSGLEIVSRQLPWSAKVFPEGQSNEYWKDITILLGSGHVLPTIAEAPKLQYVQLLSAGANHVLDNPLFSDTDIAFCTANGVHG
jgi:hypothetical protein